MITELLTTAGPYLAGVATGAAVYAVVLHTKLAELRERKTADAAHDAAYLDWIASVKRTYGTTAEHPIVVPELEEIPPGIDLDTPVPENETPVLELTTTVLVGGVTYELLAYGSCRRDLGARRPAHAALARPTAVRALTTLTASYPLAVWATPTPAVSVADREPAMAGRP